MANSELMLIPRHPYDEVGDIDVGSFFGSIARGIKSVGKGISSVTRVVAKGASAVGGALGHVPLIGSGLKGAFDLTIGAPFQVAQGLISGGRVDKVALAHLKNQISAVREVAPYAQTVIALVPGVGSGIAGAIGGGLALAGGASISDALIAATKSALPGGALAAAAFEAGKAAIQGRPIDQVLLNALPVSPQQRQLIAAGLKTARSLAHGERVDKALLDGAINALPADAKKAIQIGMALGHGQVLQAVKVASTVHALKNPISSVTRPLASKGQSAMSAIGKGRNIYGQVLNPLSHAARRTPIAVLHPELQRAVTQLTRNPSLMTQPLGTVARRLGVPGVTAQRAMRTGNYGLKWRPLSNAASRMVMTSAPYASVRSLTDTRGLSPDGLVYVVEAGDDPSKIAEKLTGKKTNWPQLIAANPQKKTKASSIGKVFATLWAGEKLKVPSSWHVPVAVQAPGTAPPANAPQIVVSDPARANVATILQAKGLLVTWTKTDGARVAGFPDYGLRAEDLSPQFGERDRFIAASFAQWSNGTRGTQLPTDGLLTDTLVAGLRDWAENRVAVPVPPPPPAEERPGPAANASPGEAPAGQQLPQSPGIIPTMVFPTLASPPQVMAGPLPTLPGMPTLQPPSGEPTPSPVPTMIDLPTMTIEGEGVAKPPAAAKKESWALTIAGAVTGAGLAGVPGMVAGAAAGFIADRA